MNITGTAVVNKAIALAQDVPTLVAGLEQINPKLAEQITGKALINSRSPWGTLAAGAVGWAASHYGLGWDEGTASAIGGAAVLLGSYAMRAITSSPITGLTAAPPVPVDVPFAPLSK
jgi:hypothetical protein